MEELSGLIQASESDSAEQLAVRVAALRERFVPVFNTPEQAAVINVLDDLDLFLERPTTLALRRKYVGLRISGRGIPGDDPQLAVVADFVDYLARLEKKPDATSEGETARNDTVEGWREYLAKFPDSPKADAAQFRLTRLICREYRTQVGVERIDWPEAPIWSGYKEIGAKRAKTFDAERVFGALDEYEAHFPEGRYAADVRLLRGGAAQEVGDYSTAIRLLAGTLADESKRDLHLDAAIALAGCYLELLDDSKRVAVADAIRGDARGMVFFERFVRGETCGSRLRPLLSWVKEG